MIDLSIYEKRSDISSDRDQRKRRRTEEAFAKFRRRRPFNAVQCSAHLREIKLAEEIRCCPPPSLYQSSIRSFISSKQKAKPKNERNRLVDTYTT